MEVAEKSATLKVSPKYQVVIPAFYRKDQGIKKGQSMVAIEDEEGQLVLIPVGPITEMRGKLPKMSLGDMRDHSERF